MALQSVSKEDDPTTLITLDAIKAELRVEHDLSDDQITELMGEVITAIEEETGRDYLSATWDEVLPGFPCYSGKIELKRPPLIGVTSVTYFDGDGTSQTLDSSDYIVVVPSRMPGFVEPAPGIAWPATQCRSNAVTIRFTSGVTTPPPNFVRCVKAWCKLLWEGDTVPEAEQRKQQSGIDRLLHQLRHGGY